LRVPVSPLPSSAGAAVTAKLPPDAALYVTRVHRLRPGDRFLAFDPETALEADAEVIETGASMCLARFGEARPASVRPTRAVTLIQGTAKGDKMDAIVRDATELGATRVVPAVCERSVSRPESGEARALRLWRIAVQAARHCGRGDAPRIEAALPFGEALDRFGKPPSGVAIALDPRAEESLRDRLLNLPCAAEVVLIVGPEGGLSDAELALCDAAGVHRVSLGPLVLRTETVCAAVLGALLVLGAGAQPP
jgi:16S rRNA (uracil1498-N3)-methyltransferase